MKKLFILISILVIFTVSCGEQPVSNSLKAENYSKAIISSSQFPATYVYSQSSSSARKPPSSSTYESDGIWSYSSEFLNAGDSLSTFNLDTLRFDNHSSGGGCYSCYQSKSFFIKIDQNKMVAESLVLSEGSYYQAQPDHHVTASHNGYNKSLSLKNMPFNLDSAGNIVISITGNNIRDYITWMSSSAETLDSDYNGGDYWSNTNSSTLKMIKSFPDSSFITIRIIKTGN